MELTIDSGDFVDFKDAKSVEESLDSSVIAVLTDCDELSDPPSVEPSVAKLCFEGVLCNVLVGRAGVGADKAVAFDGVCPCEGAHNRPRNRDAAP